MYKAVIPFSSGENTYKAGQEVPENLPYNDKRLAKGLIIEVKVVKPSEIKDDSQRKSKNKAKSSK